MANLPQALPIIPPTSEIVPIAHAQTLQTRTLINTILQTVTPSTATFSNTILPLAQLSNSQIGTRSIIAALRYGASSLTIQHAVEEHQKIWRGWDAELHSRNDVYLLIKAVKERDEPLNEESRKLVEKTLLEYEQSGHGKFTGETIETWLETRKEIDALCTEFTRNVREFDDGIEFTDEELEGLPQSELEHYPLVDGKRLFPIKKDACRAVMRYANSPETRKKMQLADFRKLVQNVDIFRKMYQLRDQNARLMGLRSHVEYRLPNRIASSTEWIDELLSSLQETMLPLGQKRFEIFKSKVSDYLAASGSNPADIANFKIPSWDFAYYNRLIEEEAAVDQEKIAEYFPLRHTVGVMLDLFAKYLQLRFDPISPEDTKGSVWNEDIEVWSVWDERPEAGGAFVGYLYADLLEQPNKYKHYQCVNLQPVSLSTPSLTSEAKILILTHLRAFSRKMEAESTL
jgi:metallopeptidase MepB